MKTQILFLALLTGAICAQERSLSGGGSKTRRPNPNTSTKSRFSSSSSSSSAKSVATFNCPQDFGYYAHPSECSKYYVCVFGGALLEECTGGLMYSNILQTCDWPRNVVCNSAAGAAEQPGRSQGRPAKNKIQSATESLAASSSSTLLSRGLDNSIRIRQPVKSSGTSKSIFDDSSKVDREGRLFQSNQQSLTQRLDRGFQAQETSSRAFNVVPSSAASPKSKLTFPPTSNGNRFVPARATTEAPKTDNFGDFLNLNDTDYYYYYDDIFDDYHEPTAAPTTTTAKPSRGLSRSRGREEELKKSASSTVFEVPTVKSQRRGSSRLSNLSVLSPSLTPSSPTSSPISSRSSSRNRGGSSSSSSRSKDQRSSSRNSPPSRLATNRHPPQIPKTDSTSTEPPIFNTTTTSFPPTRTFSQKTNILINEISNNFTTLTDATPSSSNSVQTIISISPKINNKTNSIVNESNSLDRNEDNTVVEVESEALIENEIEQNLPNEVEEIIAKNKKKSFPIATITVALLKERGQSLNLDSPFRKYISSRIRLPSVTESSISKSDKRDISLLHDQNSARSRKPETSLFSETVNSRTRGPSTSSRRHVVPRSSLKPEIQNRRTNIFSNRGSILERINSQLKQRRTENPGRATNTRHGIRERPKSQRSRNTPLPKRLHGSSRNYNVESQIPYRSESVRSRITSSIQSTNRESVKTPVSGRIVIPPVPKRILLRDNSRTETNYTASTENKKQSENLTLNKIETIPNNHSVVKSNTQSEIRSAQISDSSSNNPSARSQIRNRIVSKPSPFSTSQATSNLPFRSNSRAEVSTSETSQQSSNSFNIAIPTRNNTRSGASTFSRSQINSNNPTKLQRERNFRSQSSLAQSNISSPKNVNKSNIGSKISSLITSQRSSSSISHSPTRSNVRSSFKRTSNTRSSARNNDRSKTSSDASRSSNPSSIRMPIRSNSGSKTTPLSLEGRDNTKTSSSIRSQVRSNIPSPKLISQTGNDSESTLLQIPKTILNTTITNNKNNYKSLTTKAPLITKNTILTVNNSTLIESTDESNDLINRKPHKQSFKKITNKNEENITSLSKSIVNSRRGQTVSISQQPFFKNNNATSKPSRLTFPSSIQSRPSNTKANTSTKHSVSNTNNNDSNNNASQSTSSVSTKKVKHPPATITFAQLRSSSSNFTNKSISVLKGTSPKNKPTTTTTTTTTTTSTRTTTTTTTPKTVLKPISTPLRPSFPTSLKSTRNNLSPESKDMNETSSNHSQETGLDRGSSRNKPSASNAKPGSQSGGRSPDVVGRTPQRLVRPSKKPLPQSSGSSYNIDIWKYPPRRPNPLYPQPQADVLATKCDRNVCKLPDCSCGQGIVPGNIPSQNVPQMILLTFDDSVNDLNTKFYVELFEHGRVNPNGCPIAATFYISHEWTDYAQVQNLYSDGHEIASHSITHSFGEQFSTAKWAREIGGQREIMSAYGGVRMEDIRGMRAPFLAVGGNNMFRMLYDLNFTYDSSMPVYENNPPSWPYTLDYKIFHDCMIPPCPTNSYPGVWQVPMVMWQDLLGGRCSMGDACTTPPDAEGVYKMLIQNFERHYTTNRAPMGLFYHAAWFSTAHHKEGFIAFLDTIAAMDDVWLVTNWQMLQWVRDPKPLAQAKAFKPFQCDYPERPPRCTSPKVCNVWHKGSVRYMKTCHVCPDSYPWTGNTGVKSPLNNL